MLEWADMNALSSTMEQVRMRRGDGDRYRSITTHLPEDLHCQLSIRCTNTAQSESEIIAAALRQYLEL